MSIPGITSNIKQGITDTINEGSRTLLEPAQNIINAIETPETFMSTIRSRNLPKGGEPALRTLTTATVVSAGDTKDWRVSLSIPSIAGFNSPMLAPLKDTDNKFVFPYTPTIILSHSSNYSATNPTHSNYTYFSYVNSQVDQIMITGEFVVENSKEAQYWLACLHYLRSVSKMFYGSDANSGAPPPVVKLNGYGDYVFNNVPVVIQNFTVDLMPDVDYIEAAVGGSSVSGLRSGAATSRVPTRSAFSITISPIYSRKAVEQFSLTDFVSGKYVNDGKGFI